MIKEKVDRLSSAPIKISHNKLEGFVKSHRGVFINNQYESQLEELFLLKNPRFRFDKNYRGDYEKFRKVHLKEKKSLDGAGEWFYFPWLNQVIHFLSENMHQELRTGRNRFLITEEEQKKYYNARVGVIGMSVGSHAALTIVLTGGAKNIRLADPDEISGSNLNRIRSGFGSIGLNKTISIARQIYEVNPYSNISIYPDGVSDSNLENFLTKDGKLDILVEEMDNPYLKLKVRDFTKKHRIPVIMAADNGDNIIVDVERYDTNKNLPILHGILGKMRAEDFKKIEPKDLPRTIAKIAGANMATRKMQKSVLEVGRTIYSWPQLGTAATLCGATLAYLARQIILGAPIKSQRTEVNLDSIFEPDYFSKSKIKFRKTEMEKFLKKIGLNI